MWKKILVILSLYIVVAFISSSLMKIVLMMPPHLARIIADIRGIRVIKQKGH